MHLLLFLFFLFYSSFSSSLYAEDTKLKVESEKVLERSREIAKFYELPAGADFKEVTEEVLNDQKLQEDKKKAIRANKRKIFVFTYPSDGLQVKGLISFVVPDSENHPVMVVLRGGNKLFATPHPGSSLLNPEQCTVIAPLYRDGVSEGTDEFGGDDINDVKNLVDYIPELENKLNLNLPRKPMFLLGSSRGGMEMFLTLSRYPELQTCFSKIVSLSGLLDMCQIILDRPDMEEMFVKDFGLEKGINEEEWINKRDPLLAAENIKKDLPILIIQGTADDRVSLNEGYHMVEKLKSLGNEVTYWEIEGGDHCLNNINDRMKLILDWLENS